MADADGGSSDGCNCGDWPYCASWCNAEKELYPQVKCPVHQITEPCPTCCAYIAAGL